MWRHSARPRIDVSNPVVKETAMMMHPALMDVLAGQREHDIVTEAEKKRVLSAAREARRTRKARAVRGQPTGTLSSCEPSAVVPAR
jgi:hypothetical protein